MLYPSNRPDFDRDKFNDDLLEWIDERFLFGNFETVDRWLAGINTFLCDFDFLLSVLVFTLPAKNKLSNRSIFFKKCKVLMSVREDILSLLKGLE